MHICIILLTVRCGILIIVGRQLGGVKKGVRGLRLKKDKDAGLRDNIPMHYKGLGQVKAKITWSKDRKEDTIPELQQRLIEIIKLMKGWPVPDEPPTTAPHWIAMLVVGTLLNVVKDLDPKAKVKETEFNVDARKKWKEKEESVRDQPSREYARTGKAQN